MSSSATEAGWSCSLIFSRSNPRPPQPLRPRRRSVPMSARSLLVTGGRLRRGAIAKRRDQSRVGGDVADHALERGVHDTLPRALVAADHGLLGVVALVGACHQRLAGLGIRDDEIRSDRAGEL